MAGDIYNTNVSVMLHCNGANNSTVITDSSIYNNTFTAFGNAKISTDQSKFGGSSLYFDGSGDSVRSTVAAVNAYKTYTEDFSLELWVYPITVSMFVGLVDLNLQTLVGARTAALVLGIQPNRSLAFFSNGGFTGDTVGKVVLNQWNCVELARIGGVFKFFVHGTLDSYTYTSSLNIIAGGFYLGGYGSSGELTGNYHGYMDEIKLTRFIARHTASYTPETHFTYSISLTEAIAASSFYCRSYDLLTGELSYAVSSAASSVEMTLLTTNPQTLVVTPIQGNKWKSGTVYVVDDWVFPTDPITTPYFYKRLSNGTSGSTEPTWSTGAGSKCNDGIYNNCWQLVERLAQPFISSPIIPS